jgi:hypothetical protein
MKEPEMPRMPSPRPERPLVGLAVALVLLIGGTGATTEPAGSSTGANQSMARSVSRSGPKQATVPKVFRKRTLIAVNGRPQLNGLLEFTIEPEGERPTNVRIDVSAKTRNKRITKELSEELGFALGERYKVIKASDMTIRINAKKRVPSLSVSLKRNDLAGVSVMIGRGR